MKKIISIVLSVILLLGGGVGLYFGVIKNNSPDLRVSIEDMTLTIGATGRLNYSCSIDDALVTFTVTDESVASVSYVSGVATVTANSVGSTEITLNANYKTFQNSCTATITVVQSSQGNEDTNDDALTFENLQNVTFADSTFTMNSGANAIFTVTANFDIYQINEVIVSENVLVEQLDIMPNTYKIYCTISGTYSLTIRINTNKLFEYTLIVE